MNDSLAPMLRHSRVWFARTQEAIGWAGVAGLASMTAAALIATLAWPSRSDEPQARSPAAISLGEAPPVDLAASEAAPPIPPQLVHPSDVPLLQRQIKQIAVANGLGWPAADYRITPATDSQPSSLEVRSAFKGPYPRLRSMLLQVLREVPAATLRELSLSRGSSDAIEVEAKVVIAVLLQDNPAPAMRRAARGAR